MIRYILVLLTLGLGLGLTTAKAELLSSSSCKSNEFPCKNGQCIKRNQWCDKTTDCKDGTDEIFCLKKSSQNEDPNECKPNPLLFLCSDGTCIPIVGKCDRAYECPDNSDETNCPGKSYRNNKVLPEPVQAQTTQNRPSYKYSYLDPSPSYTDLPYANFKPQLSSARDWIKSQQEKNYGWGDYTTRAVISMYLSRENVFPKSEDDLLMDKQLDIELFVALRRNETNTLSLCELALFINSLLASCKNPRNFYGYNLVNVLRERTDKIYLTYQYVSPLVHLTLCLSNATRNTDLESLHDIFNRSRVDKIDIISLAVLASSCIIKKESHNHPQYRRYIVNLLLAKIRDYGLPGNIYELSLTMQALNAAEVDPKEWERDVAMESILRKQNENGSFGDVLGTYYTIPILSGKTLFSLSSHCGQDFSNGKTPLDILKNTKERKISVTYTLHFGDPMEMSQKITLQVAEGTNFLDVMRLAEEENQIFRFSLDETKNIPFVYSIGGVPNDAERGLYWTLHVLNSRYPSDFIPYGHDIKKLVPSDRGEIRFSQKQM